MQLGEAIKERKSVKKFTGKEVDWKKVIQAIDLTRFAPMAGNMFSVKFIIIRDKNKIKKIADACQQPFINDAGIILVVVSDKEKVDKMFDYNKKGFAQQQAGAAIQNLLLSLTEKKIDHCWVGFFDDDLVRESVKVPNNQLIETVIALGIGAKIRQPKKPRPELENLVFFEKWGNSRMEPDQVVRHDYA
jgi:nitroreductase